MRDEELFARAPGTLHLPRGWAKWERLVRQGHTPRELGFACDHGHLNRFAARFRVARAFRSVDLDDYAHAIVAGYSALFRVFLTWTAFEQYLKALACKQEHCLEWFGPHVPADAAASIKRLDVEDRFIGSIHAKAKQGTRDQIARYLRGEDFNFTYLASAIRHVFAHGILTPHASRADPEVVGWICGRLAAVHLRGLSADFERRLAEAELS